MNESDDAMDRLAGIQYGGENGVSAYCLDSVLRLLQCNDEIVTARILTCGTSHALLLNMASGSRIAVKSGFSTGYVGEGPRTFSHLLMLLFAHRVTLLEHRIDEELSGRLDASALTIADVLRIEGEPPRAGGWNDYVLEEDWAREKGRTLWQGLHPVIPMAIIDSRLFDLAVGFWTSPDARLVSAWRRLEDTIRVRAKSSEHGAKLFAQAFLGKTAPLTWPDVDDGERAARTEMFKSSYGTFRNPRAHCERDTPRDEALCELLAVNQLFRLEATAVHVPPPQ